MYRGKPAEPNALLLGFLVLRPRGLFGRASFLRA
jgi:hypothetical protein